jgi:hypothetical protein
LPRIGNATPASMFDSLFTVSVYRNFCCRANSTLAAMLLPLPQELQWQDV